MPLTRPITVEEDITMSISTIITGLMTKYNSNGLVNANAMFQSILGNTALGINQMIEESSMTIVQKSAMRKDLKEIAGKAFRSPLALVNESEAPHQRIPLDAPMAKPGPVEVALGGQQMEAEAAEPE